MTINVTQEHIDKGKRHDKCECAVALALVAAGCANVSVYEDIDDAEDGDEDSRWFVGADVEVDGRHYGVELPEEAQDFVRRFDMRAPVQPFSFELDV